MRANETVWTPTLLLLVLAAVSAIPTFWLALAEAERCAGHEERAVDAKTRSLARHMAPPSPPPPRIGDPTPVLAVRIQDVHRSHRILLTDANSRVLADTAVPNAITTIEDHSSTPLFRPPHDILSRIEYDEDGHRMRGGAVPVKLGARTWNAVAFYPQPVVNAWAAAATRRIGIAA